MEKIERSSFGNSGNTLLLSGGFLVLANLVPLFGAFFLDWSIFEIVILYWAENIVIGLFTILRIMTVAPPDSPPVLLPGKLGLSAFFTVHYGIFCLVHGVFIVVLLGGTRGMAGPPEIPQLAGGALKWALLALGLSHAASFVLNYLGKGENRATDLKAQMVAPYPRIVVLHLAILFGAFVVMAFGQPVLLLAILVVGKTILDLQLHR
ncbi:MAG: DUF6498-containing protein, partial [Verrucomicrobiales bacterium]